VDAGRFSMAAQALYDQLGTAATPLVIDARRNAAFDTDDRGVDLKVTANQWYTLGRRAEGDRFTASFDGKPLFTTEDETFATPGKVALWTKADSVTHFDTISITPLD
jgi:hypothetical protein